MIQYDELMRELDKYRPQRIARVVMTEEQREFIRKCRNHENPIPPKIMVELWEELGWGHLSVNAMEYRCELIGKER